jgi:hypothetical protein
MYFFLLVVPVNTFLACGSMVFSMYPVVRFSLVERKTNNKKKIKYRLAEGKRVLLSQSWKELRRILKECLWEIMASNSDRDPSAADILAGRTTAQQTNSAGSSNVTAPLVKLHIKGANPCKPGI